MFAFKAATRPLGLAASLCTLLLLLTAAGPVAAADEGYLGVMLQELTPSMGKALQLGDRTGVLVNDVLDDSPAEKAGLNDGDIILELNGHPVADQAELTRAVRALEPGDEAEFVVLRDGRQKTLTAEIGRREAATVLQSAPRAEEEFQWLEDGDTKVLVLPKGKNKGEGREPHFYFHGDDDVRAPHRLVIGGPDRDRGWLGVHMDALNEQLGEYFGVRDGEGVLVTEVVADSPAQEAGLRAGDVIVGAGDDDVESPDDLHEAMAGTKPGDELNLTVVRKGSRQTLIATLGKMPADAGLASRLEIIGDDDEGQAIAPRMLRRLQRSDRDDDGEREIIIERKHQTGDEMDELRQEMDALRDELKLLREQLRR